AIEKAITPMHEWLAIDVFVILGEVESPLQGFVDDPTIVLAGQPQLGLHSSAEQRASKLVQSFAFNNYSGRWPGECFGIADRDAHVFEPQGLERLEPEHVTDHRSGQVRDRTWLKQIKIVSYVCEILILRPGDRIDAKRFCPIAVARRQPVCPNDGPSR